MLRHAETPKGSRRVPTRLTTVHSRPVTRLGGSACFFSPASSALLVARVDETPIEDFVTIPGAKKVVAQFESFEGRHPERSCSSGGARDLACSDTAFLPARFLLPMLRTRGVGMTSVSRDCQNEPIREKRSHIPNSRHSITLASRALIPES